MEEIFIQYRIYYSDNDSEYKNTDVNLSTLLLHLDDQIEGKWVNYQMLFIGKTDVSHMSPKEMKLLVLLLK